MIVTPSDSWEGLRIGPKAVRLQKLSGMDGVNVPNFVVLSGEFLKEGMFEALSETVTDALSGERYVVRSAALNEDTSESAMAGAYSTEVNISANNLEDACRKVLEDALTKGVKAENFSIVIQEYVEPERSGTLFTRDPRGYRESRIEFVEEVSASAVGGDEVKSVAVLNDSAEPADILPEAVELARIGRQLEKQFTHPQDIEWIIANGKIWVVQSRDITTLSKERIQAFRFLDTSFTQSGAYYFEQSAVAESFSRPMPLDVSLLRRLYRQRGPVARTYTAVGVKYRETEQFKIVGNQLFLDKHEETRSLFPAMGHHYRPEVKPHVEHFSGLWTTIRNLQKLSRPLVDIEKTNPQPLLARVVEPQNSQSLEDALRQIEDWYPHVFRINLGSQHALSRPDAPLSLHTTGFAIQPEEIQGNVTGNSLALSDSSVFSAEPLVFNPHTDTVHSGWLRYRELGRWLTVRLVSDVRSAVQMVLQNKDIPFELEPFATLEEIIAGTVEVDVLRKREDQYQECMQYDFPSRITSFPVNDKNALTPVAPGTGEGVLCQLQFLSDTESPKVLLVDRLTPDLVQYLDEVEGVVSRQGGVLSHFAIMAREHGVPVVVGDVAETELLGRRVVIDGTNGTIRAVD